jgi:deoxyxylulose-5-phosphate synthase
MTRLVDRLGLELLASVNSPADLKRPNKRQLPQLAAEMRSFLLATGLQRRV